MLKNEPINSTAHYPHHAVWKRARKREGGGIAGSIYGEEAERQSCKSGEKNCVVKEGGRVTERDA